MKRLQRGILFAFEGIDGAGKTTQVNLLADFLREAGFRVVTSKEPTDGPWGRKIKRSAQNGRMPVEEEIHAFTEDRKAHVHDLIGPNLDKKRVVILDRYFYSTIAYQGSRGADVAQLDEAMHGIAPEPDLVFVLDVTPREGIARIEQKRNESPNAFENVAGLSAARKIFRALARKHGNIRLIDGTKSIRAVHAAIRRAAVAVLKSATAKKTSLRSRQPSKT
jgi:dTMP kinase